MRTLIVVLACIALALPRSAWAQAAEVRQMFDACERSGGTHAATYNDWVAQNGCQCGGVASGQVTCSAGTASASNTGGDLQTESANALAKGMVYGNGQMIGMGLLGLGLNSMLQSNPQADAARAAQEAAEKRRQAILRQQAEQEMLARQELAKQRILGQLKDAASSPDLQLKTDSDLTVATAQGAFGSTAVVPVSADGPTVGGLPLKLGETGAEFSRKDGNRCPPSQDASVVDLCGVGEDPAAVKSAPDSTATNAKEPIDPRDARVIAGINSLAKAEGWSPEKLAHLNTVLLNLAAGDDGYEVKPAEIDLAWDAIRSRGGADLAREASGGAGPGIPGAGLQTHGTTDCAIFALANATGRPYGVVSALATDIVHHGSWRSTQDQANPQAALEHGGGLNGGEVVMVAETLGQAEVVPIARFAKTLTEGRSVLVDVVPRGGKADRHEVVLTKSFQHDGETWYEVMDSGVGPVRRLYMSATELSTVINQGEPGVAFRHDAGTTPKLIGTNN